MAKRAGACAAAGVKQLMILNDQLAPDERFPPKLWVAFVLSKLPTGYANLRDSIITSGSMPDPTELHDKVEQLQPFIIKSLSINTLARGVFCFNCASRAIRHHGFRLACPRQI